MKLRQSKIFFNKENPNKKSKEKSKKLLTKISSFEIASENCDFDSENIPKLIIRRKRKNTEITHNKKNECLISNRVTTEITKLSNIVISEHIARCSKFSKFIDCNYFFENFISKINFDDKVCWNNLYSPKTADSFLASNFRNISKFKNWLESWNQSPKSSKHETNDSDFENDDFIVKNSKSKVPPTICILYGCRGVGKSSLVYAISSETNYTVFETNCSSRRTGKDILSKLENAANNQQIKFTPAKSPKLSKKILSEEYNRYFAPTSKKLKLDETLKYQNCRLDNRSLFLFDDMDVVMDEDKGLFKAICSLVEKRPIILTVSDSIELKKIISQLGKHSYIKIQIEQSPITDIAVYLQLILLSRGLVVQHGDMLQWMLSTCSVLDLRSCLNNLQFASVNRYLDFKPKLELLYWDHYKIKNLSLNFALDNENFNSSNNKKLACKKAIYNLSSHLTSLVEIDSQIPFSNRRQNVTEQRDSTIDIHCLSQYDSSRSLLSDINETLVTMYNKNLHESMNDFEKDFLLSSPTLEFSKVRNPKSVPSRKQIEFRNRITDSLNVRSVVSGAADRMDRWDFVRAMATLENNRKSNFTQRRFTHYFDRIHLQIQESDLKYLTTPFKNNSF